MSRVLRSSSIRPPLLSENNLENVKQAAGSTKTNVLRPRKPVLGDRTNLQKITREEPAKRALQDRTNILKAYRGVPAKKALDDCGQIPRISRQPLNNALQDRTNILNSNKEERKVDSSIRKPTPTLDENFEEVPMEVDDEPSDKESEEESLGSPDENFLYVSEYSKHIFQHLRSSELKFLLSKNFISRHPLITCRMRYVLVDWLCSLHSTLELDLDSLHLTVCILDQYINYGEPITKDNLQLIGVTALLVASKFEDIRPPLATDLSEATNNAVTSDDILKCEVLMLRKLDFNINIPLPITFYRRLSRLCRFSAHHHFMGKYLLEIGLVEADLCYHRPSMLAAAAIFLVCRMFGINHVWNDRVERSAFYTEFELNTVVTDLAKCVLRHTQPSKYRAVRNKYASDSNYQVSSFKCIKSEAVLRIAQFF